MLKRTGHFWEKRYYCEGFAPSDRERALNTLRYIHGNPKAAKMRKGFFYDFSNYGSYERLTDDGLTQWHPAFLQLGSTLEECAQKYRGFCQKYKPKGKTPARYHWGSRLLSGVHLNPSPDKKRSTKANYTQKVAAETGCQVSENVLLAQVVRQFIEANRAPWEAGKDF
jgi:putative transposase